MAPLRFRYQTVDFDSFDIHLRTLHSLQEFSDPDGAAEDLGISSAQWPIFGVLWQGSMVLANLMATREKKELRILEVGCGIGLASLILNHRGFDITATDQHPRADDFLQHNAALNGDEDIPFFISDWADEPSEEGGFDLIIGSDLLYERERSPQLATFVDHHARSTCEVVFIDSRRGHQNHFTRELEALGFTHQRAPADETTLLGKPYKGNVHRYAREA